MIDFFDALNIVADSIKPSKTKNVPIQLCVGFVLAENIISNINMPPFNKSAVDGFAFNYSDIVGMVKNNEFINYDTIIYAGEFRKPQKDEKIVKIMTGAKIPENFDTICMIEFTENDNKKVKILNMPSKGDNACILGEDISINKEILKKGTLLNISHISLLAALGCKEIKVFAKPTVSIINTGNEIIPVGNSLKDGEIYNSNGPQFVGLLKNMGIECNDIGIVKDDPQIIEKMFKEGLKSDILLISGGVSMGDYDFVPDTLQKVGVKKVFHKVKMKPGKPLFFGTHKTGIVFGIPGNPVSNFVEFQLFVKMTIKKLSGHEKFMPTFYDATLTEDFTHKGKRKNFHTALVENKNNSFLLTPVSSNGSADILALAKSNAFLVADENIKQYKKGETIKFFTWNIKL